jgi:hypothetical protein
MKQVLVAVLLFLGVMAAAPSAQAFCSGYYCGVGNCPYYQHLIDDTFENGCNAWYYGGTAGQTTSTMCGWTGDNHAYITSAGFIHGGLVKQGFTTSTAFLDNYNVQYIIDLSGMQSGDYVTAVVRDLTTSTDTTLATYTSDASCDSEGFVLTSTGWNGHNLELRFEGYIASSSTMVKLDYVAFWQKTY